MKATLKLDIPSEELTTQPSRLARVFGAKPRPLGHERVVGSTLGILEQLIGALRSARIHNIISLRVDMNVLYEDQHGRDSDLPQLEQKLARSGAHLNEEFQLIQLALEHREQGMHYVLDLTLNGEVSTGDEELTVGIAGRPEALEPAPDMGAADYRDHVAAYAIAAGQPAEDWQTFTTFVEESSRRLAEHLHASRRELRHQELGITMPSSRSLCATAAEPFGRHRITFRRRGYTPECHHYYWDPYSHCHEDPFSALLNVFVLHSTRQHGTEGFPSETRVYNADGSVLGPIAKVHDVHLDDKLLREFQSAELLAGLDTGVLPAGSLMGAKLAAQRAEDTAKVGRITARGRRARAGNRASGQSTSCRVDSSDSPT